MQQCSISSEHFHTLDQREALCYKPDMAQLSTLIECTNEWYTHLVVAHQIGCSTPKCVTHKDIP